jgi:hypothetical protein
MENKIFSQVKKLFLLLVLATGTQTILAQETATILREAKNLELKFDEAGALSKYREIITTDPANIVALVKCAEFNCSIGNRQQDNNVKKTYFNNAFNYAQNAYSKDSASSNTCYAMALVATKKSQVDDDNKDLIEDIKAIKIFCDKAIAADAQNAKANYLLGLWHFELIRSGWIKKRPVKEFYHGIFDTQLDSAALYMEKARTIEPYFAIDHLDLAKLYIYDHQPAKAIEVLEKLIKLPNRTYDDAAIKKEGQQLLATLQ